MLARRLRWAFRVLAGLDVLVVVPVILRGSARPWWSAVRTAVVLQLPSYAVVVLVTRLIRATTIAHEQALGRERALTAALRAGQDRFQSLVHNAADVVCVLDGAGVITMESPAAHRVLGHPPHGRSGRPIGDFMHPEDAARLRPVFARLIAEPGGETPVELRMRHEDGGWRTVAGVARNLLDDPAVAGIVVHYRDVTEQKALEAELIHQARHDPLTGLANRAVFADRLEWALAQRTGQAAVLMIDLDGFKSVNDTLGHAAGDRLLVAVAARLGGVVRSGDTVARIGGDEFAILLTGRHATEAETRSVAIRALAALSEPVPLHAESLPGSPGSGLGSSLGSPVGTPVRASIGAAFAVPGSGAAQLLRDADLALYKAKTAGKGRLELYSSDLHAQTMRNLELQTDLHFAVDRGELVLHYQPIVELRTGQLVGVEALLRWQHPVHGLLTPGDFIPVAERTGLIVPVGRWVLRQACARVAAWQQAAGQHDGAGSPPLRVSVNLSARQFEDPELFLAVDAAIYSAGLAEHTLTLEITETALARDPAAALRQLHQLRRLGLRISVDDFGTGYNALSYLQDYPVDELKIDGSFVARLTADSPAGASVAAAVITISRALGLGTVAEGIETEVQCEQLKELGCELGQGYRLSRPLTEDALTALLALDHIVPT